MSKEINKIIWRCRRGMRELDLLFRSFSMDSLPNLGKDELLMLDEILNYDDQKLYDHIFKNESWVHFIADIFCQQDQWKSDFLFFQMH